MMYSDYSVQQRVASMMYRVYGWMSLALAVTAATAFYIFKSPALFASIFSKPALVIGLVIAQFAIVIAISAFLQRLSFALAFVLFMVYAVSVGLTISSVLFVYTPGSVFAAFLVTAGTFAGMSIYGYVTKSDLTGAGNLAIMLLFGMILAMFVNMFLQSPAMSYVLSAVGVFVFTLLIAYDAQKIKELAIRFGSDAQLANKVALMGALSVYLDFINLSCHYCNSWAIVAIKFKRGVVNEEKIIINVFGIVGI